ncbi:MAG: branched-chain amino acid ABC transporter permease [Chloroflexi bacterium]|nr:branched-chain amino acid ABC transporter permease [Chloroflexota bacterium]
MHSINTLKMDRQITGSRYFKAGVTVICLVGVFAALVLSGQIALPALILSIIYGVAGGSLYILIALGLTLLFGMMNIIQFSHGAIYMLGAFVVYYFFAKWGLPYAVVLILVFIFLAVFGIFVERFLYRPLRGKLEAALVMFLGLSMLLESSGFLVFGVTLKSAPGVFPGLINFGFISISVERMAIIPITAVLLLGFYFLLYRSRYGKAMRAVSQDTQAAALQGINVHQIRALAFALSFGLAGIAGALVAPMGFIDAAMGARPLLMSIIIIILGGLGSFRGAIIAAIIVGVFESVATVFVGSDIAYLLLFVFVLVFLIFRPAGLFGSA